VKKKRRQGPYRPPEASRRLYVRLLPRHVALLKFLLEAEDNLALPTVVDRFAAVVRLQFCPEADGQVEDFVRDLGAMCPEVQVCYRPRPVFPVASPPNPARMEE
jgi:hypothetical protein